MSEEATVLGLDLTCSEKRPTAYAVLGTHSRVVRLGFEALDVYILALAESLRPALIAIDAPLGLPLGLCCLEKDCLCQPLSQDDGRLCERELAKQGIGLFRTTKKSIIKSMVYRGIALKKALEGRGFQVMEVYPYATKVALWGQAEVRTWGKKTTPKGLDSLREHLPHRIPGLDTADLNHDQCDAILAAYTGHLYLKKQARSLGDPEEGAIWVPDGRSHLRN